MPNRQPSKEGQSLDDVRLSPAKANLDSRTESNSVQDGPLDRLGRTIKAALVQTHGSGQAAAITLDIDQSDLTRRIKIGTLDQRALAAGGEAFLATFGEMLVEEFGAARQSKKQIALQRLPELLQLMIEAVKEGE